MKRVLSISERVRGAGHENLCATAEGLYDDEQQQLAVELHLLNSNQPPETVKMDVSIDEAGPATREVFHSWLQKLIKRGTILIES